MKQIHLLFFAIIFSACSKDDSSPGNKFPEDGTYSVKSNVTYFDQNGNELAEVFEKGLHNDLANELVFETKTEIATDYIYYSEASISKSIQGCIFSREQELANVEKSFFPDKAKERKRIIDFYQNCIDTSDDPFKTALFYKLDRDVINLYMFDDEELEGYYQPRSWKDLKISHVGKDVILSYDYTKEHGLTRPEDFIYDHVKYLQAFRVKGEMVLTKK